jgi:hypothetical protein
MFPCPCAFGSLFHHADPSFPCYLPHLSPISAHHLLFSTIAMLFQAVFCYFEPFMRIFLCFAFCGVKNPVFLRQNLSTNSPFHRLKKVFSQAPLHSTKTAFKFSYFLFAALVITRQRSHFLGGFFFFFIFSFLFFPFSFSSISLYFYIFYSFHPIVLRPLLSLWFLFFAPLPQIHLCFSSIILEFLNFSHFLSSFLLFRRGPHFVPPHIILLSPITFTYKNAHSDRYTENSWRELNLGILQAFFSSSRIKNRTEIVKPSYNVEHCFT